MTDVNLLSMFFDQENLLFNLDKEDGNKRDEKQEDEHGEWFSEDTLNMLLKSSVYDYSPLFDHILDNENNGVMDSIGNECSSDSGLSCEQSLSPTRMDEADDIHLTDAILPDNLLTVNVKDDIFIIDEIQNNGSQFDNVGIVNFIEPLNVTEYVKEEVVECEEVDYNSIPIDTSNNSDDVKDEFILDDSNDDLIEIDSDRSNDADEDSTMLSCRELKTVKLLNSNSRCRFKRFKKFNTAYLETARIRPKYTEDFILKKNDDDDSDFVYPRLQLTPEEQKLANKEGINLPTHYPLTKAEERDLKRIRRKIRNKISAQDSRRRKKEYVDRLEEKVKRTSEENAHLMKRIKTLESQKMTLVAQVRKLQASLARCSGQAAQPSTCLLVLIMSLALVLAPTLKNSTLLAENNEDEGISMPEDGHSSPANMVSARSSRNLLFSHKSHEGQCNIEEEKKTITEQLEKLQLPDSKVLTDLLELLKLRIGKDDSLLKDHDYFKPRKRSASSSLENESWPPSKISNTIANHVHNLTNSLRVDKTNRSSSDSNVEEPVIIDLLSD